MVWFDLFILPSRPAAREPRAAAKMVLDYFKFIDATPIRGKTIPEGYYERIDAFYWTLKRLNEKDKSLRMG